MFIQNSYFNNRFDNYKKPDVKKAPQMISFTGKSDTLTREIKLTSEQLKKVSFISETYDKILTVFSSFNGPYQKKFKSLYPNIVEGEKIKGFVFKSIFGLKDKRLQIVRFNSKANSDELLTFGVLDADNKNLLRYRINKQGIGVAACDNENLSKLSTNPFDETKTIAYNDYLNSFVEEVRKFLFYSENFKQINRKSASGGQQFTSIVSEVQALQKSFGIKSETDKIVENYNDLTAVLNLRKGKDAFALKQAYFKDVSANTKGLVFRNIGESKDIVSYCPLQSKEDDRLFRIVIHGSDNKLKNVLVFFADGRVAKQKKISLETNGFRPNNLEYISDLEIEALNIRNIFEELNTHFIKFKNFIIETRSAKIDKRKTAKASKAEAQAELLQQKREEKELKRIHKQELERLKLERKEQARLRKLEAEQQKAQAVLEKKLQQDTIRKEQQIMKERRIAQVEPEKESKPKVSAKTDVLERIPYYSELRLSKVTEALDNLFNTPVEKRSPHLVHEKLSNGNIFAGRFMLKASDGADITVSRIKSPKYVDFVYYSIKVNKDGREFVLNLDPEVSKILLSKDGKPVINRKSMVSHIGKNEFLDQNPDVKNLPKYIAEICEKRSFETRKIIKSSLKVKHQPAAILQQKEQEVLEALNSRTDDIFD